MAHGSACARGSDQVSCNGRNPWKTEMSLISFHRFLIATAIAFCFGFAAWELMTWWVGRVAGALVLGVTFVVLGGLLSYYLVRLRRFLGDDSGRLGRARSPGR